MNKIVFLIYHEKIILVNYMNYGNTLKELREELNLLQNDVAKQIGIQGKVYSLYETEYTIIPSKHLVTLADFFDVSLDYLFGFTNTKQYLNVKSKINHALVGSRLKEFRKENKLTQSKLASILNTTQSVIADYERGRYLIATPFLYTICSKYHISADYLLGKIDDPKYYS